MAAEKLHGNETVMIAPTLRKTKMNSVSAAYLQGLPSANEIWTWHEELMAMGPRFTGSPAHVKFTDWLNQKFSAVQGFQLQPTDRIPFHRWLAEKWSLSIDQDTTVGPSGPVQVSYYYPYSGFTGPGGINGKLVDLGEYSPLWYTPAFWARAKGGVALVRVPQSTFSLDIGQIPFGGFEHDRNSLEAVVDYEEDESLVTNAIFQGMLAAVPLLDAKNAGVLGVICVWTGMSDDQVANQYNPFTTPYPNSKRAPVPDDPGCPALWVGDRTGQSLARSAATGQAKVTLTLTASITPGAVTETVWGVLPGSGPDHEAGLILNTHTDGPNVPEENGALGLLALARYFAGRQRRRDLYFVMVTGHFQLAQFMQTIPDQRVVVGNDATSLWMKQNPEIYQKALAGLSIEHLGCTSWTDDANGQYAPTGDCEWGATYTTQKLGSANPTNLEQWAYLAAIRATSQTGAKAGRVVTMLPAPVFFGEGAPLYAGGLGTVSLCPVPSYLLQAGSRTHPEKLNLDKLDPQLIYGQIQSFARTISTLDAAPTAAF
jgi:MYXO-CTERM domain-containing protein